MLGLGVFLLFVILHSPQAYTQETEEWVAILKSVEGIVEVRRANQTEWFPAALDDTYTLGDSIRVKAYGRAAILLPNETLLRLDQNTTVTFIKSEDENRTWLDLIRGVIHVISRDPRALKLFTPFAGAGLEGTEFSIQVTEDETIVTVFEGKVSVNPEVNMIKRLGSGGSDSDVVSVSSGQRLVAQTGQLPIVQVDLRPRDSVQWTLYYAPILDYELPAADQEAGPEQVNNPLFFVGRAAQRLTVGRVIEAEADISRAVSLDSTNADALALLSIIALTRNDVIAALKSARQAVVLDPGSASAHIAMSYVQQAQFDLVAALQSLQTAVRLDPENALGWARLSELWLSLDGLDQSLAAARKAVSLNPNLAHSQTVLGFAYLSRIEVGLAQESFENAISLDQAAPLPRLGLGLALIRQGALAAGRAEIEMAVILDPGNAVIRSYMGKAYYEEKRDDLSASQLEMSRQLDPLDPTPWFYNAIRLQTVNRPVEALQDLQQSIELNDNRAIYRSSLKLDQDLAARGASQARIYRDLGFEQRALVEGWKSVNADPSDYSGHRFLADSYSVLPRHEIARVSELLQSQLLQPINTAPIQPQLAETNLFILSGAGPSDVAFNEFNPLFAGDGVGLQFNTVGGGNDTFGNDLVISGIHGRFSYSIGQFHYETDGFRENNDQERDTYNAFVQATLTPATSVQIELRTTEAESGDLFLLFDPDGFAKTERREDEFDSGRVGLHHKLRPGSEIIASLQAGSSDESRTQDFESGGGFRGLREQDSRIFEIQHLLSTKRVRFTSGAGHFESDRTRTDTFIGSLSTGPSTNSNDTTHDNVYLYSLVDFESDLTLTLGFSADSYDSEIYDSDQFNPKFGVEWNPAPDTTLRAAAFRTLRRSLVSDQTIEPTQVAGFNQFFNDFEGDEADRFGIAVDQVFAGNLLGGIELSQRDLKALVPFVSDSVEGERFDREEQLGRAYLYWTPQPRLAFSAEFLVEQFERDSVGGEEAFEELNTKRLLLGVSIIQPSGWTARVKLTNIDQDGDFQEPPPGAEDDRFWVADASLGYRLPKRRGLVELVAKNLTDETFQFQDTDPKSPTIQPERLLLLRANLSF